MYKYNWKILLFTSSGQPFFDLVSPKQESLPAAAGGFCIRHLCYTIEQALPNKSGGIYYGG